MPLTAKIIRKLFSRRLSEIDDFRKRPLDVQEQQLASLVGSGINTAFGEEFGFRGITNIDSFQSRVPVNDYETVKEYINRSRGGEASVLWPGEARWYAKSSGTTGDKSKFIPVTGDILRRCHLQGPKDSAGLATYLFPETNAFEGKTLTLGGSSAIDPLGGGAKSGDLSAIMIENTPFYASFKRLPSVKTALIPDFEEKVFRIFGEARNRDVTAFAGVPSWNLVMMNKILEMAGKDNLLEIWPRLELFIHGGMNFAPYREEYKRIIPSPRMKYLQTYNASEGFFGVQDTPDSDDMLLMLDYGIFYEFLPTAHIADHSKAVTLADVKKGENYALIISTCGGLWRYLIGDTVEFTSTNPYRIRVTGRTKLYINAFGEEIIIDNAEKAVRAACDATGAEVAEYTAGPVYMEGNAKGAHEWLVEFSRDPSSVEEFASALDRMLREVNSDYDAKRNNDTTLAPPIVRVMPRGTFYRWMTQRGRLGGQNKVPRLSNDRKYIDQLTALL